MNPKHFNLLCDHFPRPKHYIPYCIIYSVEWGGLDQTLDHNLTPLIKCEAMQT
jgi:hypothetical protein